MTIAERRPLLQRVEDRHRIEWSPKNEKDRQNKQKERYDSPKKKKSLK